MLIVHFKEIVIEKLTIDRDDVGHGEEGGQTCTELGEEVASLSLFRLWDSVS
jgi:hypothetical protein